MKDKEIKLLIDARSLGQKPSGVGIYIYNLVKEFYKNSEYKIVLISDVSLSKEMIELEEKGIKIINYGKVIHKNFSLYSYYKFVQKCIYDEKPDVFWEGNSLVPINIKNPYGKLAVTIHDVFPITYPKYYGWVYENYFKYGLKKTIKNFDILIYNSVETKNETERILPQAKSKLNYVGYIIVPKLPNIEISDNNSFLYIGNLEKRKGTDILIKAYKEYKRLGGKKELRLGGKIREKYIEELIDEVSKEVEGLKYLGYLENEERDKEYASCSCFVFPSKAEGFGIPIIEVMNYNKPIIASELSIFKEIVGESINYVDIGNKEGVKSLANVMLYIKDEVNYKGYKEVVDSYVGKNLVEGIMNYIRKIVK